MHECVCVSSFKIIFIFFNVSLFTSSAINLKSYIPNFDIIVYSISKFLWPCIIFNPDFFVLQVKFCQLYLYSWLYISAPPYHGKHHVVPSPWSYPEGLVSELKESSHKTEDEKVAENERLVDLASGPPGYSENEEYIARIKEELGIKVNNGIFKKKIIYSKKRMFVFLQEIMIICSSRWFS